MADTRRRALFLAPEAPYPLIGGGAFRAASLLEYLAKSYTVDAIVFRTPEARVDLPTGLVDRLDAIELPRHSIHPAARVWRNTGRLLRRSPPLVDRFSGFGAQIAALIANRPEYDLGLVEHFWCAPYHEQLSPHCRRTVLDLHNIESAWHLGSSKVAPWPQSIAHGVFHRAALDLEQRWLPRYSLLLTASPQDAGRARQIAPETQVTVYPNAIPLMSRPPREEQEVIAFSGTLYYEPNRTAVRYFAAEIWPALQARWPALKWRLIGRNPEAVERYVAGNPRIERTGPIDDAMPYLAAAKVVVAPILSGSGTRLKIVEAWAAGVPVVSTTLGAEGLPARHGENILLADDPKSFAAAVSSLLDSSAERERIGCNGRQQYETDLTWNAAWRMLDL